MSRARIFLEISPGNVSFKPRISFRLEREAPLPVVLHADDGPAALLSKTKSVNDRWVSLGTTVNNAMPHKVSVTPAIKANQP